MFVLGGGHDWIIHGKPLYAWRGTQLQLRSDGNGGDQHRRQQSAPYDVAAEGFVNVGAYVLMAALMLALERVPRKMQSGAAQAGVAGFILCALAVLLQRVLRA